MIFLTAYLWIGAGTAAWFMYAMTKNRLLRDMVEHEIESTFMEMGDDDGMRETFRMLTLLLVLILIVLLWPRYVVVIARFL